MQLSKPAGYHILCKLFQAVVPTNCRLRHVEAKTSTCLSPDTSFQDFTTVMSMDSLNLKDRKHIPQTLWIQQGPTMDTVTP